MTASPLQPIRAAAPLPPSSSAVLRPFGAEDISGGPQGAGGPMQPLEPSDFARVLGSPQTKGNSQEMRELAPVDYVPGAKTAAPRTQHQQLTEQAQKWVAQTFFGTLLKQMRDSPFKSKMFSGGRGGEAFSSLYDQHLADHMSRGAGAKLVRGIVRQIEGRSAYKKQAAQEKGGPRFPDTSDPNAQLNNGSLPAKHSTDDRPGGGGDDSNSSGRRPEDDADNPHSKVRIHVAPGLRA